MAYQRKYTAEGYPTPQLPDDFSRTDDLLIMLDKTLKQLLAAMGGSSGGGGGTTITFPVTTAKNLYIASLSLGAINTETPFQFPPATKQFVMHSRLGNAVRIASEPGKVAASLDPYITLKAGAVVSSEDLNLDPNIRWYFASSVANEVVEMIIGV